jgi:hypothetical protein
MFFLPKDSIHELVFYLGPVNATTGIVEVLKTSGQQGHLDHNYQSSFWFRVRHIKDQPCGVRNCEPTFQLESQLCPWHLWRLPLSWMGRHSIAPPTSLDSYCPEITRPYTGQNRAGAGKGGLTFVALSRVRTPDGITIVDRLDFSRVHWKLGGKYIQHRFDDYARRYPRNL